MTRTDGDIRVISGLGDGDERPHDVSERSERLSVLDLDRRTYDRSLDCVHCGLCLPACPTYTQNGLEADSPRGRIYLMKGLADGKIELTASVQGHLDLCLDCRACETACPSGVVYHELIEETRARLASETSRSPVDRLVQAIFYHLFPHPTRLKLAMLPARLLQKMGLWWLLQRSPLRRILPEQIDKMQQMLPPQGPLWEKTLATRYPANAPDGVKKTTVGFFGGCVGSVLFQDVNRQTIRLLQHAGCDVIVPAKQACCGAIHHHGGRVDKAQEFARANIDAFLESEPHTIVTNIAGCGAMLKDYEHLMRDDTTYAEPAATFTKRLRDVTELLVEFEPPRPTRTLERTVTYHDACHLAHAQRVTDPPRQILSWIKGLTVVPLYESDMCCGAAGTYNLSQPKMARELAERKIHEIQRTGAKTCVIANVGCAMQIKSEADRLGVDLKVVHPISLLHEATFGPNQGV